MSGATDRMDHSLPPIPPSEFVREMNRFVSEKEGSRADLTVFLTPRGDADEDATGWDWSPKTPETAVAVRQAFEDVRHLHGF